MTKQADITVIVPNKNSVRTLPLLLKALKNQTEKPAEILIADNGSTDDSVSFIQDFHKKTPELNIRILSEPDSGRTKAKNKAIHEALHSIIAFTDADCVPDKNWIKNIHAYFEENPEKDAVGGAIRGYQPKTLSQKLKDMERASTAGTRFGSVSSKGDILYDKFLDTANAAVRKQALEGIFFDEDFITGEDIEMTLQLFDKGAAIETNKGDILVHHMDRDTVRGYLSMIFAYRVVYAQAIKKHFPGKAIIILPFIKPVQFSFPFTAFMSPQPLFAFCLVLAALFFPWLLAVAVFLYLASTTVRIYLKNITDITLKDAFFITGLRLAQKAVSEIGKIYGSIKNRLLCL